MIWWHCPFFIDVNAGFNPMDPYNKHVTCVTAEDQQTDVAREWQAPFDRGPLWTWSFCCLLEQSASGIEVNPL